MLAILCLLSLSPTFGKSNGPSQSVPGYECTVGKIASEPMFKANLDLDACAAKCTSDSECVAFDHCTKKPSTPFLCMLKQCRLFWETPKKLKSFSFGRARCSRSGPPSPIPNPPIPNPQSDLSEPSYPDISEPKPPNTFPILNSKPKPQSPNPTLRHPQT